jgi:ribosomal protein L32
MKITNDIMERFLQGQTSVEETAEIMMAIAVNPELEEMVVAHRRMAYTNEQMEDYGSFIPISSMAADDGQNLCDFQCETYILKLFGKEIEESTLAEESRHNYWLRGEGTPLYNMGKLLEREGFLVHRRFDATLDELEEALKDHKVIVVVNGDTLIGKEIDIFSEDFSFEDNPNHAVVVLSVDKEIGKVSIYNPSVQEEVAVYDLDKFESAWGESRHYMVTARIKRFPQEYNPQPIDVSNVKLDDDLEELIETIAQDVHDIWAVKRKKEGWSYGVVRDDAKKLHPDLVPYSDLPDGEKEYDIDMATHAIKVIKRLGYRIVNINSMYRCPDCGEVIEPSNHFCPNCGRELSWKDFR